MRFSEGCDSEQLPKSAGHWVDYGRFYRGVLDQSTPPGPSGTMYLLEASHLTPNPLSTEAERGLSAWDYHHFGGFPSSRGFRAML